MTVNALKQAPFPIDPYLTGIVIAYRNLQQEMIADLVLPRAPVGKQVFKWMEYNKEEGYSVPDTLVGRKGIPNEMEFGGTEREASTDDHFLDAIVPNNDINNAAPGFDPLAFNAEHLMHCIELRREKRVADLVFNTASYDAGLQETLSGGDQWSDIDADALGMLLEALDKPLMRPNQLVLGQSVFTALRRNKSIVSGVLGNSGTTGAVSREQIANLLEIDEVVVGQGRLNLAQYGQPIDLQRVWGDHAALIYRDKGVNTQGVMSFGMTAQWQNREAGQIAEPTIGARGSVRVRSGESVKELIIAKSTGYFFQNAIA